MKLLLTQNLKRNGFTLIELLVAVTIFVVLTALVVGSFNLNIGNERVRSAARQLQATFEGARSRAFKLQRPVGVRFIYDTDYPGEVNALLLVSSVADAGGNLSETGRLRFVDRATDGDPTMVAAYDQAIQYVPSPTGTSWTDMNSLDMLRAGMRIRIPAETGSWYTISSSNFLTDSNRRIMRLNEVLLDQSNFAPIGSTYENNGVSSTYEIDLTGVMIPLQGEEAISLPNGVVIDLYSSKVPSNWRMNSWESGVTYSVGDWISVVSQSKVQLLYRAETTGATGANPPNWDTATTVNSTIVDGGVTWRCYQTPQYDVIFTPQGNIYGPVAAEGVLHFVIAETRDTRAIFEDYPTVGDVTIGTTARDLTDRDGDGDPDHVGAYRIVTVFGASGSVNVSPIDQTDSDNNKIADDLYNFAIQGAAAK